MSFKLSSINAKVNPNTGDLRGLTEQVWITKTGEFNSGLNHHS